MFSYRRNHFQYFIPFVLGVADLAPGLIIYSQNEPFLLLYHFNLYTGSLTNKEIVMKVVKKI